MGRLWYYPTVMAQQHEWSRWDRFRSHPAVIGPLAVGLATGFVFAEDRSMPENSEIVGVTAIGLPHQLGADLRLVADGFGSHPYTEYSFDPVCTDDAMHAANTAAVIHAGLDGHEIIVHEAEELIESTEASSVTLHGISAGGILQADLAVRLHKAGHPVERVELVTTPVLPEHVVHASDLGHRATELMFHTVGYPGRFIWRMGVAREGSIGADFSWAQDTARTPRWTLGAQYSNLVMQGISRENVEYMARHGIEIVYYAPSPDGSDRTIDTDASIATLREWYEQAGGDPAKVIVRYLLSAHASIPHDEDRVWPAIDNPNPAETIFHKATSGDPKCAASYKSVAAKIAPVVVAQGASGNQNDPR